MSIALSLGRCFSSFLRCSFDSVFLFALRFTFSRFPRSADERQEDFFRNDITCDFPVRRGPCLFNMRGVAVLCCAAALAEVAQAQERLEFSGLESPCDEAAGTQADDMAAMEATNDDITDQIADLQTRVDNELITYGDTTNTCLST